jgi:hypothetical protein
MVMGQRRLNIEQLNIERPTLKWVEKIKTEKKHKRPRTNKKIA